MSGISVVVDAIKLVGVVLDTAGNELERIGPSASQLIAKELKALGFIDSATETAIESNSYIGWVGFGVGLLAVAALATPIGAAGVSLGAAAIDLAAAATTAFFAETEATVLGAYAAAELSTLSGLMTSVATAVINYFVAEGAAGLVALADAAGAALGSFARSLVVGAPDVYAGNAVIYGPNLPTNLALWNGPSQSTNYTVYTPNLTPTSTTVTVSIGADGNTQAVVSYPSAANLEPKSLMLDYGPSGGQDYYIIINNGIIDPAGSALPYITEIADGSVVLGLPMAGDSQALIVNYDNAGTIALSLGDVGETSGQVTEEYNAADFSGVTVVASTSDGATTFNTDIGPGATAEVYASFSVPSVTEDYNFASDDGVLKLDSPSAFTGTITNFVVGNTIDLAGVSATGGTFGAGNVLTVQESGGGMLLLHVAAPAGSSAAYAVPDGNGGTDLVLREPVPVTTVPVAETIINDGVETAIAGLSVAIPNSPSVNEKLTVVLSVSGGLLVATRADGGTVSGADTQQLTLTGTLDAINAELASLTYTGMAGTTADTINVATSNDQGNGDDHQIPVTIESSDFPPGGPYQIGGPIKITYGSPNGTGPINKVVITNPNSTISSVPQVLQYTYTGNAFTEFTNPPGFSGTSPLDGHKITATVIVEVGSIPIGSSQLFDIQSLSVTDGITSYSGPGKLLPDDFNEQDGGSITLNSNYEVIGGDVNAINGHWPDPGSSALEGGDGYDGGGLVNADGTKFGADTNSRGTWSRSITGTAVTVSVAAGQTQQLSDVLKSPSLTAQGPMHAITIDGPGTVEATGVATVPDLEVSSAGNLILSGGSLDSVALAVQGHVIGFGTIAGDETVDGTIKVSSGALDIMGDVDGAGTLTIDASASLILEGTIAATESLAFNAPDELLLLGTSAEVLAPVSGLVPGDIIALEGQQVTSAAYDRTSRQLAVTGGAKGNFDLILVGTYQQSNFAVVDGKVVVACFVGGTHIATRRGQVPVEHLKIGDLVTTLLEGTAPVRWIGRRHIDCCQHPMPQKVWPVRVSAGAFGARMPMRDLWLSPDHAVFADGVLIPIRHLVNGATIEQVPMDEVTYYHVELPRHDVLYAEGMSVESYLDTGDRSNFENGGSMVALHPDFGTLRWEADGCAPLVVAGPQLEGVRQRVNAALTSAVCSVEPKWRTEQVA